MRYHDKANCLDLVRVTDWSKPANNGLNFRAYFVSSGSGEAGSQTYRLQKTTEGEWLIRDIGYVSN